MTIGILGTGHLAESIVHGLQRRGDSERIVLSPRNASRAAALAEAYPANVAVASSNQAVLDTADTILLTIRPQIADSVLSGLSFRPNHAVISMMALLPLAQVISWVSPATMVARAATLPYVAKAAGPVLLYPGQLQAITLFEQLGPLEIATDESTLDTLWTLTAMMAPYFASIDTMANWAQQQGVAADQAGRFISGMLTALGSLCEDYPDGHFAQLVAASQTPGGINQQALQQLQRSGCCEALEQALDGVQQRISRHTGRAPT
ncbi:NAD(P)-binding domain-containing protein [Franzmannia qiaohouensis]|uniref:NAD(P)-binding domain-containing protein n=1 Tax=Franzmannia qiaohouensis TaxID=1329370 RepID=A0ABU1HCM8_9GAMM|nr:NAD(P)-binding domain-containing protein [Halomonas qiaohouensis]MDR5904380.1 NAD(P)-binding domain-containing protein [Halomonas qiaohouensis]